MSACHYDIQGRYACKTQKTQGAMIEGFFAGTPLARDQMPNGCSECSYDENTGILTGCKCIYSTPVSQPPFNVAACLQRPGTMRVRNDNRLFCDSFTTMFTEADAGTELAVDLTRNHKLFNEYTSEACAAACLDDPVCMGFAHNSLTQRCFLSDSVTVKNSEDDYTTSYRKNIVALSGVEVTEVTPRTRSFRVRFADTTKTNLFEELFMNCTYFTLDSDTPSRRYTTNTSSREGGGYFLKTQPDFEPGIYTFMFSFQPLSAQPARGFN